MCKILVIPHVKKGSEKDAIKFAIAVTDPLTEHDSHAFGYAMVGENGLFGERWTNVKNAWRLREPMSEADIVVEAATLGRASRSPRYNSFGRASNNPTSLILHARYATCDRTLENAHPFVSQDGDACLIHNGVVATHNLDLRTSTCDSEGILNAYVDAGVAGDGSSIQALADRLQGYYACAAFAKSGGRWILDVFRDDRASLEAIYVPKLETVVFCTSVSIVRKALKALKWKSGPSYDVDSAMLLRLDAVTGEALGTWDIKPSPSLYAVSNEAAKAAGIPFGASGLVTAGEERVSQRRFNDDGHRFAEDGALVASRSGIISDGEARALEFKLRDPFYHSSGD